MAIWIFRTLIFIAGPLISYYQISHSYHGMFIGLVISSTIVIAEIILQAIPLDTIVAGIIGIVFGLIGARLLDYAIFLTDNQAAYDFVKDYSLLLKVVLAYFGLVIAIRKKSELDLLDRDILKIGRHKQPTELSILDTSAIIDGRVADIVETKFISGIIVVPRFILVELQALADSSDTFKRNRARRGLDIIAKLQKVESVTVKLFDKDYPRIPEADAKLVALAKDLDGKLVTTDFNLNKIAMLQGIAVLNVNDLSNALKPVFLPGETMPIFLIKEGKEHNQAIGYLDDGTMVVIEDGRKHVGKRVDAVVTSILQTSSGRMVFGRMAPESARQAHQHPHHDPDLPGGISGYTNK